MLWYPPKFVSGQVSHSHCSHVSGRVTKQLPFLSATCCKKSDSQHSYQKRTNLAYSETILSSLTFISLGRGKTYFSAVTKCDVHLFTGRSILKVKLPISRYSQTHFYLLLYRKVAYDVTHLALKKVADQTL